jgi:type I restriction enzyme S subunit
MVKLEELMAKRLGSVNPAKFPEEIFELYSIPAFDRRSPDVVTGAEIGSSKQLIQSSDVLLSKIVPHIRRSWVVGDESGHRLIGSGEWIVFRSDKVHPPYLRQVLVGDQFHAQFMQTVSGVGGSLLRARPAQVAKIEVPLPSLPEQRRIAAILDKADVLRTKRRKALAHLARLPQSIFEETFGDPIVNRHRYPIKALNELVDPSRPITYGILMPGPHVDGGVSYVRVVDMKDGGVDASGMRCTTREISSSYKRSILKPGDLLMSIRGHVGRFAIASSELDGANITQDSARLAITGADPVFVRECLRSPGFQHWMARHTKGVAVRGINLGDVKVMPIPLAPEPLQKHFSRQVAQIENLRVNLIQARKASDALISSLVQRAFSGTL